MDNVKGHFDRIAHNYDYWKEKNWYYYQNIKNIIKEVIPNGKKVLEIGCGTGDILASVEPIYGVGVDISDEMIKIAKYKYGKSNNLSFYTSGDIPSEVYDFILMVDLIEHLENREMLFQNLHQYCNRNTKIILLMANPKWEVILLLLEKLRLKMPEGPHHRISYSQIKRDLEKLSFVIAKHGFRQLMPLKLFNISDFINKYFYKIPVFNKLGLSEFIIFKSTKH